MKSPEIFGGFIFLLYLCIKQKKQIKIMKKSNALNAHSTAAKFRQLK